MVDLLVVGGGINGAAVARDAAGRGLSVALVEQGDLAGATSSATSKLVHGGLRYLEHGRLRLVRESLRERELLLRNAPHLVRPLEFVLPHAPGMRPRWMLRLGLLLYDALAGRSSLPRARALRLSGPPLQPAVRHAFRYHDAWTDDARLVIANVRDAADRGAAVLPRTRFLSAERRDGAWQAQLSCGALRCRAIANVAGPWVAEVLSRAHAAGGRRVRLVKGSHIVVPRLYEGAHAYLLQNDDRRVVFLIPFHEQWTLIGTTDVPVDGDPHAAEISAAEIDYLCRAASRFLAQPVTQGSIVWSFTGVRPLLDDGKADVSAVTRDYRFALEDAGGKAPVLSVFGGKLTTHRRLAERALARLRRYFPAMGPDWTAGVPLPGGDLATDALLFELRGSHPYLAPEHLRALAQRHGTRARALLEGCGALEDLGRHYGGGLYERELRWFVAREWAQTADDVLWRRTKCGLLLDDGGRALVASALSALTEAAPGVSAAPWRTERRKW
ncbi:MAG: glycerol-3-phosphate dehydrogenase [Planctomycetota bacterium]|nr:MAG: glycerol-3-phosphate dehydrogenase [Planctomycetota bacterium]